MYVEEWINNQPCEPLPNDEVWISKPLFCCGLTDVN